MEPQGTEKPPDVGRSVTPPSGCWPDSVNGIDCPCGEKRENLSTFPFTGKVTLSSNPYLGDSEIGRPYMGGSFLTDLIGFSDFSTRGGTYPQIKETYPQNPCPDKDL